MKGGYGEVIFLIVFFVVGFFLLLPEVSFGVEGGCVKTLQVVLERSRGVLGRAEGRLRFGYSI
ncbi:MAG: hypothetical protein N3G78_14070, partial [Desulfobacterota bacterium]|nr:hypothetical protein [Thermodesulfobacteriota bacterium]